MICCAKNTIEKVASTIDIRAAVTMAAIMPRVKLPVIELTTAAIKAPESSCPSMAMLVIPTRSLITPPMAPRMIGTARTKAVPAMKVTGTVAPAASQPSSTVIPTAP